jgi:hypothetical protein
MSKKTQLAELAGSSKVSQKIASKKSSSKKKITQHEPVKRPPVPTAYQDEGKGLDDILGDAQTRHITSSEDSAFYLLRQISQDRGFGDYVDYPSMIASLKRWLITLIRVICARWKRCWCHQLSALKY